MHRGGGPGDWHARGERASVIGEAYDWARLIVDLCRQSTRNCTDQSEFDYRQCFSDKDEAERESIRCHVGSMPSMLHSVLDESHQ